MMLNEIGTTLDINNSYKYLLKASLSDHIVATYALGLCCYAMNPPNKEEGNQYLAKSGAQGYTKANKLLAIILKLDLELGNKIDLLALENGYYNKII